MGIMKIIDQTGDTQVAWEVDNAVQAAEAQKQFEQLIRRGGMAYQFQPGETVGEVVQTFDLEAERIVVRPRVIGG